MNYLAIAQLRQNFMYIERLLKKSNSCLFVKFACSNIKYLEALKTRFLGFSTVSENTCILAILQI